MLIDKAFGVHPQVLELRLKRSQIISSNIANADTPNYQARDLDFSNTMKSLNSNDSFYSKNLMSSSSYKIGYRMPMQSRDDNNTVDLSAEQARFAQNAMDYQTSLTFLKMKIAGLKKAIDGR